MLTLPSSQYESFIKLPYTIQIQWKLSRFDQCKLDILGSNFLSTDYTKQKASICAMYNCCKPLSSLILNCSIDCILMIKNTGLFSVYNKQLNSADNVPLYSTSEIIIHISRLLSTWCLHDVAS